MKRQTITAGAIESSKIPTRSPSRPYQLFHRRLRPPFSVVLQLLSIFKERSFLDLLISTDLLFLLDTIPKLLYISSTVSSADLVTMPPKRGAAAKPATTAKVNGTKVNGVKAAAPSKKSAPAAAETKSTTTKRKASEVPDEEPKAKKAKSVTPAPAQKQALSTKAPAPKKATAAKKAVAPKKAAEKHAKAAPKTAAKKAVAKNSVEPELAEEATESESEEEAAVSLFLIPYQSKLTGYIACCEAQTRSESHSKEGCCAETCP